MDLSRIMLTYQRPHCIEIIGYTDSNFTTYKDSIISMWI